VTLGNRLDPREGQVAKKKAIGELQESAESLTIFLAKDGISDPSSLLKSTAGLKAFKIKDDGGELGTLYIQPRKSHVPRWAEFFRGQVDEKEFGRAASAAAVLVVPVEARTVLLTFGQGRHIVDPQSVEDRFGRRVSLNSIAEDRVRSIDKQNFETLGRLTRVQSSKESRPADLGLDTDEDLVRTLTGAPKTEALGKALSGVDSLHAMVAVDLHSLRKLLLDYVKQFGKDSYKKTFPWADHITAVSNSELIDALDDLMLARINAKDFERCWLAVPEPINWSTVLGFRFRRGAKQPIHYDISFETFLATVDDVKDLSIPLLKRRDVHCVGADDVVLFSWPVYKCIYCEVEFNESTYLLSDRLWYAVERDFVKRVDDAVKSIPTYSKSLPEYDDGSEGAYSERVAKRSGGVLALMDRKLVTVDGRTTPVEFCDLYSDAQELIHIKRYGGSGVLSHLFAQGTVSGQLFASDAAFRKAVNALLPKSHRLTDAVQRPQTHKFSVVFAIVSRQPGNALTLPFFSRLRLRQAARDLRAFGYEVAVAKIQVSDTHAKTTVYKAKK